MFQPKSDDLNEILNQVEINDMSMEMKKRNKDAINKAFMGSENTVIAWGDVPKDSLQRLARG